MPLKVKIIPGVLSSISKAIINTANSAKDPLFSSWGLDFSSENPIKKGRNETRKGMMNKFVNPLIISPAMIFIIPLLRESIMRDE